MRRRKSGRSRWRLLGWISGVRSTPALSWSMSRSSLSFMVMGTSFAQVGGPQVRSVAAQLLCAAEKCALSASSWSCGLDVVCAWFGGGFLLRTYHFGAVLKAVWVLHAHRRVATCRCPPRSLRLFGCLSRVFQGGRRTSWPLSLGLLAVRLSEAGQCWNQPQGAA